MTEKKHDDGGPAFPNLEHTYQGSMAFGAPGRYVEQLVGGMSLWAYFAAKAMAACIQTNVFDPTVGEDHLSFRELVCQRAGLWADSMIAEMRKREENQ